MTKTFSRNGLELVFYQKEGDEKYSFYLKDEPILTEHLLNSVKTKRVREDKIKYAVKGIFNLIFKSGGLLQETALSVYYSFCFKSLQSELLDNKKLNLKKEEKMRNPIIELSERVQSTFGENIETRVVGKMGPDHEPKIFVEIILPDGNRYKGEGANKRLAKQDAAKKALEDYTASVEAKATR